jgi:AraC-like DNA-binding protein
MRKGKTSRLGQVPTANGGISRAAYDLASRAHINLEPFLKTAGLTVRQATSPDARIDVQAQIVFLDLIARALDDEFLGIRLAMPIDLRELGLLYYVMASSETLGDALRRVSRYSTLQNEGVHITYRDGKDVSVSFDYAGVARLADRHQIEFVVTFVLRICRELTGLDLTPRRIRLVHHRTKLPPAFARLFGGDVRFNSGVDDITFSKSVARLPVTRADPYLNSLMVRYCDDALAKRPRRSTAWRLKVENVMAPLLPHGRPQIEEISRRLGVSPRTLARRLAAEKTNFNAVLDNLRRDLARRHLKERDMPISEVAWLLGYQDPSAFNHAFRRWTGTTPKRARTAASRSSA